MSNLTREDRLKIKADLDAMKFDSIDYISYRNEKIHYRRVAADRAFDITHRKDIRRLNEITFLLKDEFMACARKNKTMDENGRIIVLD